MKKFITVFFILILALGMSFAQDWEFEKVLFIYDELEVSNSWGMHGVAVDADGNIWCGMYGHPTDSIVTATDTTYLYGCNVLDPEGNPVAFSPVNILSDAVGDTIVSACRGLATAHDGNILLSVAGKMYKINYQTGEGMGVYDWPEFTGSLTKPAVDENGNIFLSTVGPGNPVKILNPDLTELGTALADNKGCYNRAIAVSPDGKDMYLGSTWNGLGIRHYHSDLPGITEFTPVDTLGNWVINDTTVQNMWPEDVTMGPDGNLYAANTQMEWSDSTHGGLYWVVDPATGDHLYSLGTQHHLGGTATNGGTWNGRGAAWSAWSQADGVKMYLADFGYNSVTVWNNITAIDGDKPHVLSTFELLQNYPNPFNPTTTIPYTLEKQATVELKVYSTTGELVSTLVDDVKQAGPHEYKFNGSELASGMYIYNLKVDGKVKTKRMILIK